MSVFSTRLKQARRAAGISQEWLGILVGIDEMSASARMNQYERGKHEPDFATIERLAYVLKVPASFFFAAGDEEAELLRAFHPLDQTSKEAVLRCAQTQERRD
ncbi:Helix-turn-helix domain [Leminorella richardii]|uniref:Helix-turn-helix domain n=1 Tax=Leminorella richardii TaxID=158841 RepID=A0A2X4USE6_9GAMM|nr:helix-turn-helix transcriptional regulator [Leminorella richardii]SQI42747.1 Helix-turn-helix domain [Leminorella richardii]